MRGTQNECTKGREHIDGGSADGAWPWPGQLAKCCAAADARPLEVKLVHDLDDDGGRGHPLGGGCRSTEGIVPAKPGRGGSRGPGGRREPTRPLTAGRRSVLGERPKAIDPAVEQLFSG
jgi:hypothetical protein